MASHDWLLCVDVNFRAGMRSMTTLHVRESATFNLGCLLSFSPLIALFPSYLPFVARMNTRVEDGVA